MEICLWAQLLQLKYDAISRKFIVSLTKSKHDKTNIHTKTNIQTTVAVLNVLDHSGRQQGDRLGHPGSADGAVGVGPLVAGRAHQVALGAAVDGPRGGHLQAHWALDTFLQLLSQGFQGLLARLQLALN